MLHREIEHLVEKKGARIEFGESECKLYEQGGRPFEVRVESIFLLHDF